MHARQQLGASAAHVTPKALREATLDGSVETFALARPGESNKFVGVYIYLDEVSGITCACVCIVVWCSVKCS